MRTYIAPETWPGVNVPDSKGNLSETATVYCLLSSFFPATVTPIAAAAAERVVTVKTTQPVAIAKIPSPPSEVYTKNNPNATSPPPTAFTLEQIARQRL